MTTAVTDRIQKQVLIKAPRARVWRALTTPAEFGAWFGANFETVSRFEPGAHVRVPVTMHEYTHLSFEVTIEQMAPERLFSFRWHPNPIQPEHDYASEPTTLVVFELSDADKGHTVDCGGVGLRRHSARAPRRRVSW